MNLTNYLKSWGASQQEVRFLRLANLGLVMLSLILATGWMSRHEVVTYAPPPLAEQASIGYDKASDVILEQWGVSIAELLGNVTPTTADYLKKTIAPMLAPQVYHRVLGAIEDQVAQIKREQVTVRFAPTGALRDPATGHVLVTGEVTTTGVQGNYQTDQRTYDLDLAVMNYRIVIRDIGVMKGAPKGDGLH